MIEKSIKKLVCYGRSHGLFEKRDEIYVTNLILDALRLDSFECDEVFEDVNLEKTLKEILDYAESRGIIDEGVTARDLFDTKLMGLMMPRPSEVTKAFYEQYEISPKAATEYYYKLSCDSDYIRRYRIKKDLKWKADTEYGELDITVNLSKPEKDPKAIAAAKNAPQNAYPKCMLCKECEGYAGRMTYPARQNHRIIPITVNNSDWCFQYSPYVYYNEHCIVFNAKHTPMAINHDTFVKLFDFVKLFPHYFLGSNADLPIVGGSILSHDHFQGGNYTFAMARAKIETELNFKSFEDIKAGIVKWPMSVIRLKGESTERLISLADKILASWRNYSDEEAEILAETGGEKHNTITPIARHRDGLFELDLALRNNRTSPEHPMGIFHPHAELHHIKKENIGLIEVMGLAVLPARLKGEISALKEAILKGEDIRNNPSLSLHADWIDELKAKYTLNEENTEEILKKEIGIVFGKVLEHAGVFKRDEKGLLAFKKFAESVK